MQIRGLLRASVLLAAAALVVSPMTAAFAEQTEPMVSSYAWYWESQRSQPVTDPSSGADVVTIEAPNPFCPSTSAGGPPEQTGACHPGRLPVQVVNSDYETPEMISAVAFDLSLVPLGSDIKSFKATFLEADDDQSQPLNPEGHELQACVVEQFFGDGEAREYEEAPRFTCSDTDPIAKREEIEVKNEEGEKEQRFAWTFDLTPLADRWVSLDGGLPVSAIMLFPVKPKDPEPSQDAEWRVVLDGPAEPNGIMASVVYEPAEFAAPDTGTDTGTDFGSDSTGSFDTGSTDFGSTGTAPETTTPDTTTPEASDPVAIDGEQTSDLGPVESTAGGLPGYVWLAILVGLMGFSLVRSVVIESATGVRSDGVLAQIQKINADRRGTTLLEEMSSHPAGGPIAPVIAGLRKLGEGTVGLAHKLPFFRKKG